MTLRNTAILPLDTPNFTLGMNAPLSDISYHHAEEAGLWKWLLSLCNAKGAESKQPVEPHFTGGWSAETMQESFVFLILGVGRLREDQLIYVETREDVFLITWDL